MRVVDRPEPVTAASARLEVPSVRTILIATAGLLVIQFAWILVLPAFGGMDEFDHSYRASAVAHGQWVAPAEDATRGTGAWVYTDPSLPEAAYVECTELPYTTPADCSGSPHGNLTRVASGAGRYNPLFYAAIGYPTLPLHGSTALIAMRVLTAIYSTGLILVGLLAMRRWARNRWPFVGALLALTPTMLFSTTLAAPNGVEMAAGFAFWAAILGLLLSDPDDPDLVVLTTAAVAAVVLVTIRSLGPLWCVSITLLTVLAISGSVGTIIRLLRRRAAIVAAALVAFATIAAVAWTRQMGSLTIGVVDPDPMSTAEKVRAVLHELPLWLLQGIAAFPYRNVGAPVVIYACYLVLGLGLVVLGWRGGDRRLRMALVLAVVASFLIPGVITFATFDTFGTSWQGRYGLPFSMGLMFLAGLGASQRPGAAGGPSARLLGPVVVAYGVCTVAGVVHVLDVERDSASIDAGLWTVPPVWWVVALAVLGTGLLWSLVAPPRRTKT